MLIGLILMPSRNSINNKFEVEKCITTVATENFLSGWLCLTIKIYTFSKEKNIRVGFFKVQEISRD